jgi:Fe-S cluster biogenesis protein NfuA/nitrite reductase/ring-hydroxylating ferredoxin subunit
VDHPAPRRTSSADLLDRVQSLSDAVDDLQDPRARDLAHELVGAVVAMYGDGLGRIVATIESAREAGATIMDELAQDGAVASLLLIHDLYPVSLRDRVLEALDSVRPYMESHGGNVELLGIENGVARLALQGSCHGCAASRSTLELAIKQAIDEQAPDLLGLEVEGLDGVGGAGSVDEERPVRWLSLDEVGELAAGELRAVAVDGVGLVVANVAGSLLAYRDACAACGEPLHAGELAGPMLRCPHCEVEFDLPRAGRAGGGEPLQLAPVPLLREDGLRVAV